MTTSNIQAERRALSCLLKGKTNTLRAINAGLTPDCFTEPTTRALFRAIVATASSGDEVGFETVLPKLSSLDGKPVVDMGALFEIDNLEVTSAAQSQWVNTVIVCARKRALQDHLGAALRHASCDGDSWGEIWENVSGEISKAQEAASPRVSRGLAEICDSFIAQAREPGKRKLVRTGLPGWDSEAGALRSGELVVIGARPGAGKTAIALQIAGACAASGGRVGMVSLEMKGEELLGRMVLTLGGKDAMGHSASAINKAVEIAQQIKRLEGKLFIYDQIEGCGFELMEARARLLAAAPGGLSLLVVDYLQLLETPATAKRESRERQVAEMSRRLKLLAGQIDCPIIVLAQLNRETEKEDRMPRMSDLRESGAIEQDADRVWLLAVDPDFVKAQPAGALPSKIHVQLIQGKCRGGRAGIAKILEFDRPLFRFNEAQKHG
jgi:replicative DNA helicase